MRGMLLQLDVGSLCLCNNLRSVVNSYSDTSTCAFFLLTLTPKPEHRKNKHTRGGTCPPWLLLGGGGSSPRDTHTHALPPTCSLASVLWLITELVSVCFCLVTQCIYTDFVIFPASQYWKSAELRGNTQTGVRNKKKNPLGKCWYGTLVDLWKQNSKSSLRFLCIFLLIMIAAIFFCWWFLFVTFYSCTWSTGESDTLCIIEERSPLL